MSPWSSTVGKHRQRCIHHRYGPQNQCTCWHRHTQSMLLTDRLLRCHQTQSSILTPPSCQHVVGRRPDPIPYSTGSSAGASFGTLSARTTTCSKWSTSKLDDNGCLCPRSPGRLSQPIVTSSLFASVKQGEDTGTLAIAISLDQPALFGPYGRWCWRWRWCRCKPCLVFDLVYG